MNTALISQPSRRSFRSTERYSRDVSSTPLAVPIDDLDSAFAAGTADLRAAYDAHGGLVYSICRRSLDGETAKDVTQEVFVSAWRGREQFDPRRGSLAAWLVGITKRRIIDHLRSEGRHADRRADEASATPASDESDVERVGDRMLVADGLRQLPGPTREIIELAFVHDLTHQQIAERTGTPLGTVKSTIRRGLLRIKDHMESSHV